LPVLAQATTNQTAPKCIRDYRWQIYPVSRGF